MSAAKQFIQATIAAHKVVVWSKTYCPYCTKAKTALSSVGASFHLVELDHRNDGDELQNVLQEMTGARSVPRVFVNGKCIGVSAPERSFCRRSFDTLVYLTLGLSGALESTSKFITYF